MQQGQRQLVDAHIVVFPIAAGGLQGAGATLDAFNFLWVVRHVSIAIDGIGQAQAIALPLADLGQQMGPGDAAVVRAVKPDARQLGHHAAVHIGQQTLSMRHTGQQGEVSFGDAEGQISTLRRAPAGHLLAALQHHAADAPTGVDRAKQSVVGGGVFLMDPPAIRLGMRVTGPGDFVRLGVIDGVIKTIHRACPPSTTRV